MKINEGKSGNKKKLENQYGKSIFQHFAKDVMYFDGSKRQNEKQKYFRELLEKVRCAENGKEITEVDAKFLLSFHLQRGDFTNEEI